MVKLLLFIKHNLKFLWALVEFINSRLFILFHEKKVLASLHDIIDNYSHPFTVRILNSNDTQLVKQLMENQNPERLKYFRPHGFDEASIRKALKNRALITMGVFEGNRLVGYFFLRCFWNKKCFVGRLVDQNFEGKGIGKLMNKIMYSTAWASKFRCFSTISRKNLLVMKAHANNPFMMIRKELPNDYLFVEFLPPDKPILN